MMLKEFEKLKTAGTLPEAHEDIRETFETEGRFLRYLKPVFVKKPCLACHGAPSDIPGKIRVFLKRYYPEDRATGFKEGDLYGAISVKIPVK
jgi:hypothetical protein